MDNKAISIRPFIGAKDFEISRNFYSAIGFQEVILFPKMSLFKLNDLGFYLQDYYVKDWIDNTMVFMEVPNADEYFEELLALNLESSFKDARLQPVRQQDWGRECFLIDPSGILWHFGEFNK